MNDTKSTEEIIKEHGYLPCILREESDCMYREKDDKGFYRKCGMCALMVSDLELTSNITFHKTSTSFPDWKRINRLKLYENSDRIGEMKNLLKLTYDYKIELAQAKGKLKREQKSLRKILFDENKK